MIRRLPGFLAAVATLSILVAACGSNPTAPALTDPKAIVTAALKSTNDAKSVHLEITVDGTATLALPIAGGTGTPVDLTGSTAAADIDFAKPAARATFSIPSMLGFAGELIGIDGKSYLKTTLTGPLYQVSASDKALVDPTNVRATIASLGTLLFKPGVNLVKGGDVACGSKSCYTVSADLTAEDLGTSGAAALGGLPVDLAGATMKLTMRVEMDLPYHLAGITAVVSMPKNATLTFEATASKWDVPVVVTAPPANQVKPPA